MVVKIVKDVGPLKMGCDGLAYVSGEHWLWESKSVLILGIIKRGLEPPSVFMIFNWWKIRKSGSFSKLGYVSSGGTILAIKSGRRLSVHGDGGLMRHLVGRGDTWTTTQLPR